MFAVCGTRTKDSRENFERKITFDVAEAPGNHFNTED